VLDGTIVAAGPNGQREIPAASSFHTVFTTDLHTDEMIERIELPILGPAHRVGFAEFSRRAGDFALVMTAAVLDMDGDIVRSARLAVGGATDVPVRLDECEEALAGRQLDGTVIGEIADMAAGSVTPLEDIHASVDYRRDLIRAMTRRALSGAT
jgi:carbon-monoxide dehydrogenase medium subunit